MSQDLRRPPQVLLSVAVHLIFKIFFNVFFISGLEWAWLREFFFNVVLRSIESKDKVLVRRNTARNNAIQERNLVSKFLYRR